MKENKTFFHKLNNPLKKCESHARNTEKEQPNSAGDSARCGWGSTEPYLEPRTLVLVGVITYMPWPKSIT